MPAKRAQVPDSAYKRAAAIEKLAGGAAGSGQEGEATAKDGTTVIPQNGMTARAPQAAKAGEKTTFYLRPDQVDKLDELSLAYKRKTGKRVNRNDLVRQLIDQADLDSFLGRDERA